MKKVAVLLAIACSIATSQFAYANHHDEKCEGMSDGNFSISGLDADKDGVITKVEYLDGDKSNTEKVFNHIDANSDGKLDEPELADIEAVYKAIHKGHGAKNTNI